MAKERIIYDDVKVISRQAIINGQTELPNFISAGIKSMDEEPEVAAMMLDFIGIDTTLLQD